MPYKVFAAGEEALASDVNNYLMSQTLSRHPSASARNSAITAPVKGQITVLDTDIYTPEIYTGSAWTAFGGFYLRFFNQTGFGNVGSGVTVGLGLPAITPTARLASYVYDLMVHVTNPGAGAAQSATFQVTGSTGGAPAVAPVSVFSHSPFIAVTVPVKAIFRSIPAGTTLAPNLTCIVGTGGIAINIGGVSGTITAFPPNSEY
jgi:hypothetical protein